MYKKILAPADGSENSRMALKHGAELTRNTGGHLTVIHVLDLPPQLKSLKSYHLIKGQLLEEGEKILREAREICTSFNIPFSEKMCQGVPANEILHEAHEGKYDLIVIGSRGMGEVKGWVMGSVSRRVARHARCPVLVVK
jgi:nucleotide-binding universal stress UspA family protein